MAAEPPSNPLSLLGGSEGFYLVFHLCEGGSNLLMPTFQLPALWWVEPLRLL